MRDQKPSGNIIDKLGLGNLIALAVVVLWTCLVVATATGLVSL